jgi:hypothetical protein
MKNEMGGACGRVRERDRLKHIGVDGRLILKMGLQEVG